MLIMNSLGLIFELVFVIISLFHLKDTVELTIFRTKIISHHSLVCKSANKFLVLINMLILILRFDYLLISHFLLNLQDISNVTTDDPDVSRASFSRSNLSSIRFNRVLGNIGAELRDGSHEFEEDEDVDNILSRVNAETTEVHRSDEEGRAGISSFEASHAVTEEYVAESGRLPTMQETLQA